MISLPLPGRSDTHEVFANRMRARFPNTDAWDFALCATKNLGPLTECDVTSLLLVEKACDGLRFTDWTWLVELANGEMWKAEGLYDPDFSQRRMKWTLRYA